MQVVIGLVGTKGSGKTTAFKLMQELKAGTTEIMLANKLKQVCSEVFGIPRISFEDAAVKEKELNDFITLNEKNVSEVIKRFKKEIDYDKHIRPHIGKILISPRQIAQYIGTEVLRNVSEDIHCEGAVQDLVQAPLFVVTDIRFWNEYNFFNKNQDLAFFPVYISNYAAEAKAASDKHPSEAYVLEIAKKCERIDNNGSMQDFKSKVTELLARVSERTGI